MKKVAFFLFFATVTSLVNAQDIGDVKDFISNQGYDLLKAKAMIDKVQANPKYASKPEGFYYKGVIYNAISKKDSLKAYCPDCKMQAFEALKKYQELDSKSILLVLEQNNTYFDIYGSYFTIGATAFNNHDYS